MQNKTNIRDIIDLLEYKVQFNICTDEEYGLYLDYRNHGSKVFKYKINKNLVINLIDQVNEYRKDGDLW